MLSGCDLKSMKAGSNAIGLAYMFMSLSSKSAKLTGEELLTADGSEI